MALLKRISKEHSATGHSYVQSALAVLHDDIVRIKESFSNMEHGTKIGLIGGLVSAFALAATCYLVLNTPGEDVSSQNHKEPAHVTAPIMR